MCRIMAIFRVVLLLAFASLADAGILIKDVGTKYEFDNILQNAGPKPVIVDFYSTSCGPCVMMAPIYRRIAKQYKKQAIFIKVDVNRNHETSASCQIRSMPTFQFYLGGKLKNQFSGAGEQQLVQYTQSIVRTAEAQNVEITREELIRYYQEHDPNKAEEEIDVILDKFSKKFHTLARMLKKKYGKAPKTQKRTTPVEADQPKAKRRTQAKKCKGGHHPVLHGSTQSRT